jgi:hypothetical protein
MDLDMMSNLIDEGFSPVRGTYGRGKNEKDSLEQSFRSDGRPMTNE